MPLRRRGLNYREAAGQEAKSMVVEPDHTVRLGLLNVPHRSPFSKKDQLHGANPNS